MAAKTGLFQGSPIVYYHQTANAHTPGQPYQQATFVATSGINSILEAPGHNETIATEPATAHLRRVLVRRAELPPVITPGDKWVEPDGTAYEIRSLPWGDPASATLWLVGERSAL
jgi:hypothetical protein